MEDFSNLDHKELEKIETDSELRSLCVFHQTMSDSIKALGKSPLPLVLQLEFLLKITVPHMRSWPIYLTLLFLWLTAGFFLEPYFTQESALTTLSLLIGVVVTLLVFPLCLVFYKEHFQTVDDFEKRLLQNLDHLFHNHK